MACSSSTTTLTLLHNGVSITTSSSRNFCSFPITSRFHETSSGLPGRLKLRSLTAKLDRTSKIHALGEAVEAAKPADSDATTNKKGGVKTFTRPKQYRQERNVKRLNSAASKTNNLDYYEILKNPLRSESAVQNIANSNTLVFVVDKRADKKSIREAAEKMLKIETRKVNTSIMPDGVKKAYLMLKPKYNASEVAKKIQVF